MTRAMIANEAAMARCRRDGGTLWTVEATDRRGLRYSNTYTPRDACGFARDFCRNGWSDIVVTDEGGRIYQDWSGN